MLPFRNCPTFVRTGHWVAFAQWPVVVDYIIMYRKKVIAVVTTKWALGTKINFMSFSIMTLVILITIRAFDFCKLTANKLFTHFWNQIQVEIQMP